MKAFMLLIITYLWLFSCKTILKDVFDKRNYNLVKVDSLNGKIGTQYYTYKYDTFRKLQIDYYADGKLLGKSFTYKGQLDGKFEYYNYKGELAEIDSFSNGVKMKSKSYFTADTAVKVFRDGKLIPYKN